MSTVIDVGASDAPCHGFLLSFDAAAVTRVRALAAPASSPVPPRTRHHAVAPQAKVSEDDMRRPTCWLCEDGTILEVGNRRAKAYEKHLFYNQINAAPTANVQRGVGSVDAA